MCTPAIAAGLAAGAAGAFALQKGGKTDTPTPPKLPETPAAPKAPQVGEAGTDQAMQQARTAQTKRAALAQGRGSTILTGPLGLSTPTPIGRKTLLGQ